MTTEATAQDKLLYGDTDEQVILAQCLYEATIVPYIVYGMKDWYFNNPKYKVVFRAIQTLEDEGKQTVDINTVYNKILATPSIRGEVSITISDISKITIGVPYFGDESNASLTQAINRVREAARLRYMKQLAITMKDRINEGETDSVGIQAWFEEAVEQLIIDTDYNNSEGFEMLGDYADEMAQMYKDFHEGKITALEMPFPKLNELLGFGGLMPNDLVILAAHTSFGKTTLALKIAKHVIDKGGDVAMFSLEMARDSLFIKLHSTVAQMNSNKIRPFMSNIELKILLETLDEMRGVRLFTDTRTTDLYELRAKAKRLKKRNKNLKLIIVDYLQLIGTHHTSKQGEKERIAEVSRMLKLLAQELQIPVIALSQFSRDSYKNDAEPRLSDLYGSGAIEKDADHVWFIHGEKPDHKVVIRLVDLIVAKQRKNGGLGRIHLLFNAPLGDFEENLNYVESNDGTEIAYKESDANFREEYETDNAKTLNRVIITHREHLDDLPRRTEGSHDDDIPF